MRRRDPLEQAFASLGFVPAAFQREAWAAAAAGQNFLIHAPTGAGKTWAAYGDVLRRGHAATTGQLHALWITPLRALSTDTVAALKQAAATVGIDLDIRKRTGDISSAERAALRRRLPHTLVTTPESLSLLMSHPEHVAQFAGLQTVVVDEWHELLGSKRGVQLELCLSRLRALRPALQTIGLSATIGNLDIALRVLLGPAGVGDIIDARTPRPIRIDAAIPPPPTQLPWAGHLGLRQLPAVVAAIDASRSTLLFTNTRSQAELWFQALVAVWHDDAPLGLHHGSIDRAQRQQIEDGLRDGVYRCVVATSSLDLGVDFSEVDQVIQIGTPKGLARLLQRAGRANHRPGLASRVLCVPTQALELIEITAARSALAAGEVESRQPLVGCIDVLAQHLATRALGGGFTRSEIALELRQTHAYAQLSDADLDAVLNVLTHGGSALASYPHFQRVQVVDGVYTMPDARVARLHRMSIGTIASDGYVLVRFRGGATLGHVEEAFLSRLSVGDRFVFAGRTLMLKRLRADVAEVRLASGSAGVVPRWMGSSLPLSSQLAAHCQREIAAPSAGPEQAAIAALLGVQQQRSALPGPGVLLAEYYALREGHHLFLFPFAGRLAHEGLAALLAHRLLAQQANTFTYAFNDYGLVLRGAKAFSPTVAGLRDLLQVTALQRDIEASVNLSDLAKMRFRAIAQIAGLVVQGPPGARKGLRQLMQSTHLLYDVLCAHDPTHVLLRQARDEVYTHTLDYDRLRGVLDAAASHQVVLMQPQRLTPFAFPLWAERLRGTVSNEDWLTRLTRESERAQRA